MIVKGLSSSHCASGQVWGMALLSKEKRLITGSGDSELRVWDLTYIQEVRHSLCNSSAPLPSCLSLNWDGAGTCSHLMDVLGNSPSNIFAIWGVQRLLMGWALLFPVFWAFKWSCEPFQNEFLQCVRSSCPLSYSWGKQSCGWMIIMGAQGVLGAYRNAVGHSSVC